MNAALWVLLTMTGVSLYATFDVRFSLGKISGVLLGVLLYWAVTRWMTTASRLRMGTLAFLMAGAGLAVVGLLGTNWIEKFPVLAAVSALLPKAIRGIPGAEEGFQPNAVAGCLVLFVPLQVALLSSGWRPWLFPRAQTRRASRWFVVGEIVLLALTAGTLVLTQSRGAFVGLAAALGTFLLWHSRWTRVIAVVGVGALVVLTITLGADRLAALAISQSGPGMAGNVSGRVELWSRALYGIQDFPITGMGMNTFRKVMPVLYPTFLSSPDADVAHAHNHFLQATLDLGIPGLIAYAALWLITGTLLVTVYRNSIGSIHRATVGGLGAGMIAHFTFSMTDAIPLGAKVGVLFWLALALVVGLHRVCCLAQSRDSNNHSFVRR
jgi:putative inorganic carbon (hco3(-)) transporter